MDIHPGQIFELSDRQEFKSPLADYVYLEVFSVKALNSFDRHELVEVGFRPFFTEEDRADMLRAGPADPIYHVVYRDLKYMKALPGLVLTR